MTLQFSWVYDAPAGAYKNHALSMKIREAAIADTVFVKHCKTESGFGKHKGETINIVRYPQMTVPTSAILNENDLIPEDTISVTTTAITIQEYGRAIPYSNLTEELTFYDIDKPLQVQFKKQGSLFMDGLAATAFKSSLIIGVPTSLGGITWYANGTPGTPALVNLNAVHMGLIRDYLRQTLITPYHDKDSYCGIFSEQALRGIKSDPDFMYWRHYLKPEEVIFDSEVGKIEQIRTVATNNTAALSATKGTNSVLGEGVVFGEDAVAEVMVEPFHLMHAIPGDGGRKKAVMWYTVCAYGSVWPSASAGQARIVYITSS